MAPIHNVSDKMVSYNKYPIICISKKEIRDILMNPDVQSSIDSTLELVGTELFDRASIHIRIVDSKAHITDYEKPIKEIISIWR